MNYASMKLFEVIEEDRLNYSHLGVKDDELTERLAKEIRKLIREGADVNVKGHYDYTALMFARTPGLTKLLIEAGADVNAKALDGKTALMFAGSAEQTKLLIEAGADVNAKKDDGRMAWHYGKAKQQDLLVKAGAKGYLDYILLQHVWTNTSEENVDVVKEIIEEGANVNATNECGQTALMLSKTIEVAKLLLNEGADATLVDEYGKTAYDYATDDKKVLIASYMEKKAAKAAIRGHIEERKANIKKSRQVRKRLEKQNPMEKVSGVVLADEIAQDVISGKEKRTITPEVGAGIKRKKAMEK